MNEQNDHIWMHKKPETVFDWLAIIAISIALYLMLGHLNVFAGGIAKFWILRPLCQRHCDRLMCWTVLCARCSGM